MGLKLKCSLLQRTESGQIGWVIGLWYLLFFSVLLMACLQLEVYRASSGYLEDALASSNLAAAVIDVEEYGKTHRVLIGNVFSARDCFEQVLKLNLGLNDNWECENREMISGPVRAEVFIVYNVDEAEVVSYRFDNAGNLQLEHNPPGSVVAPNGVPVEATGIYSEISYEISGIFGTTVRARRGKLVDVYAEKTQREEKEWQK